MNEPSSTSPHGMRRAGRILNVSEKSAVMTSIEAANSSACATGAASPNQRLPMYATAALTTSDTSNRKPIATIRPKDSSRLRRNPHAPLLFGASHFQMRFRSSCSSANTVVAPTSSTANEAIVATRPSFRVSEAEITVSTPSAPVSPSRPDSCVKSSSLAWSGPITRPAMVMTRNSSGPIDSSE